MNTLSTNSFIERALPGIGDAPGGTDADLLKRMTLPDGTLLQPDRPPFPHTATLDDPIEVYWTAHRAGECAWLYVVLLNLTNEQRRFDVAPPVPGDYVVREGISGTIVEGIAGELPAGRTAYYVLAPVIDGISPLGLIDKYIPAPAERFFSLRNGGGLTLGLDGVEGRIGFFCEDPLEIRADGQSLPIDREGKIARVAVAAGHKTVEVRRR